VQPERSSYAERLARKYGRSVRDAEEMIARMTAVAAADGVELRFDRIRPGNTFDAHRLLHLARGRGLQDAMKERLLRGYLTEGEPIGDPATLARLAVEAGLDAGEVEALLAGDAHAEDVRDDEREALRLGIHAVPFFVLDGRYGISGAQPVEVLERALVQVAGEASGPAAQGPACGPDGCG
jgi:predicted DsbA family dithiol-disulfide isomerase